MGCSISGKLCDINEYPDFCTCILQNNDFLSTDNQSMALLLVGININVKAILCNYNPMNRTFFGYTDDKLPHHKLNIYTFQRDPPFENCSQQREMNIVDESNFQIKNPMKTFISPICGRETWYDSKTFHFFQHFCSTWVIDSLDSVGFCDFVSNRWTNVHTCNYQIPISRLTIQWFSSSGLKYRLQIFPNYLPRKSIYFFDRF